MRDEHEELLQRRKALKAHILAGGTPKEFAYNYNLSYSLISKEVVVVGFKKTFLTDEEIAWVMERRKQKKAA
jgi:hypothetical protein